jgi:hypothetical protein
MIVAENPGSPLFTIIAMLVGIPEKIFYPACTEEKCLKKVTW